MERILDSGATPPSCENGGAGNDDGERDFAYGGGGTLKSPPGETSPSLTFAVFTFILVRWDRYAVVKALLGACDRLKGTLGGDGVKHWCEKDSWAAISDGGGLGVAFLTSRRPGARREE